MAGYDGMFFFLVRYLRVTYVRLCSCSFVLWDGSAVAETVAFGSSMSRSLLSLKPGDAVTLTGAELGWRGGVLQLRIDNRKTRVEHRP